MKKFEIIVVSAFVVHCTACSWCHTVTFVKHGILCFRNTQFSWSKFYSSLPRYLGWFKTPNVSATDRHTCNNEPWFLLLYNMPFYFVFSSSLGTLFCVFNRWIDISGLVYCCDSPSLLNFGFFKSYRTSPRRHNFVLSVHEIVFFSPVVGGK